MNFKTIKHDIGAELFGFSAEELQELARRHAGLRESIRSGLLTHLLEIYCAKNNKSICCEKTPMHINYVDVIIREIPRSHVVCIHRDPRDVWLSVRNTPWHTGNALYHAIFWRHVAYLSEKWARMFPKRYLEIRFEDLLAEPRTVLERVCQFVQVRFSTDMLQWYLRGESTFSTATEPWKSNARRPLDAARALNWKKRMSPEESALFEAVDGKQMQRLHYDITSRDGIGYGRLVANALLQLPGCVAAAMTRDSAAIRSRAEHRRDAISDSTGGDDQ